MSNQIHRAYIQDNDGKKEVIATFRGTKNLINDIPSDLGVLFGYKTHRDKEAETFYKNVKEKYPDYHISLTGNSLGGYLASNVSKDKNDTVITHNKGQGLLAPFETSKKNEKHYRNAGDIISLLSGF